MMFHPGAVMYQFAATPGGFEAAFTVPFGFKPPAMMISPCETEGSVAKKPG